MKTIHTLTKAQRKKTLEKVLKAFILFCKQNFNFDLYDYEREIAYWCLYSLLVEPIDLYIKVSRQSGKTETITLVIRFLLIFYRLLSGEPLMAGIASPKGEQAKTDLDRIKKSIHELRGSWHIEDREFNAVTVRAYRFDQLHGEIFKFSLAPTTTNESKTLNLLIVEEAHKADDVKRADQLDPMLTSTGGPKWMIGVGCVHLCDFKKGCDGELAESKALVFDVERVITDRRKKYNETKDAKHLEYEKAFKRELKRAGRENPEIKRNYYLEDTVEEGNFVSRERLLSCARSKLLCATEFYLGLDWGRQSDSTWAVLGTEDCDVVTFFKYPHAPYEEQIEMLMQDLKPYKGKIVGVCGDSTGMGDFPMEYLETNSWLPIDEASKVKFTLQSKNEMYTNFDAALFRAEDDELRFSYPADHRLSGEFEDQMTKLLREYKGEAEMLSPHHPDVAGARDDACDGTALMLLAASGGGVGDIVFV